MTMCFDDFLSNRMDELDNAVYVLLRSFLMLDSEEIDEAFPWDMEIAGSVSDQIEDILAEHGYHACRPYYEGDNRIPCYCGTDCQRTICPMRSDPQYSKDAESDLR